MKQIDEVKILVVGLGGLGGFVAEGLARMGATDITLVDCTPFDESNINRQLFCSVNNIGKSKVFEVKRVLGKNYKNIKVAAVEMRVNEANVDTLLDNADIVFDCVDNIATKLLLERRCIGRRIPLIHGGVVGPLGQVSLITQKPILERLFANAVEKKVKHVFYGVGVVACIQLACFDKWLQDSAVENVLYFVNLNTNEITHFAY